MSKGNLPVRAVFLVGFMGSGKTSVGRALAELLHWCFEDLDDGIVAQEGRTVAEIFEQRGEIGFRQAEAAALRALVEGLQPSQPTVVALGGGAFTQAENAALLARTGHPAVCLDAPVDELWRRCEENVERPLRRDREQFKRLYAMRRADYLKATLLVDTNGREIAAIAAEIIDQLKLAPGNFPQER